MFMKYSLAALGVASALIVSACQSEEAPLGRGEVPTWCERYGVVVCADGPTLDGIDVSYYQGTIDWDAVAASGIDFAFIRTNDGDFEDPQFARNWSEARRAGVIRGVYQFFRPNLDPIVQANTMLDMMGPLEADDLPPVVDVEVGGGVSSAVATERLHQWIDHVEAATGRAPIIYTSNYLWSTYVGSGDFVDYPLWAAHWGASCPNIPDPWTEWVFWQTSETGSVPGISGAVDTDLFNGDMAALLAFAGAGAAECGDGACNGGETHETCPEDCPTCEQVPPDGRVIDEDDLCFERGGDPRWWRDVTDAGWEDSLIWTHTTDDETEENFCVWHLDLAEAGEYAIEVYTDAAYAQSRTAAYQVRHEGTTDVFRVDQTAFDGWNPVSELAFAAGGDQWVRVQDNTGEPLDTDRQIVCDALRLIRLDPSDGDGDADGDGDGDADGDSDGDADGDGDGDADGDSDGDGDGDPDAGPDADADADGGLPYRIYDDGCGCRVASARERGVSVIVSLLGGV